MIAGKSRLAGNSFQAREIRWRGGEGMASREDDICASLCMA